MTLEAIREDLINRLVSAMEERDMGFKEMEPVVNVLIEVVKTHFGPEGLEEANERLRRNRG